MDRFRTHKGNIVEGKILSDAIEKLATHEEEMANEIRLSPSKNWPFAAHVTREQIEQKAVGKENLAKEIREGKCDMLFWFNNRLDFELTGESVAVLPK